MAALTRTHGVLNHVKNWFPLRSKNAFGDLRIQPRRFRYVYRIPVKVLTREEAEKLAPKKRKPDHQSCATPTSTVSNKNQGEKLSQPRVSIATDNNGSGFAASRTPIARDGGATNRTNSVKGTDRQAPHLVLDERKKLSLQQKSDTPKRSVGCRGGANDSLSRLLNAELNCSVDGASRVSSRTEWKYERLSNGDVHFGEVIMAAKSSKDKGMKRTILLEGKRLIADAIAAGISIKSIYFTHVVMLEEFPKESLSAVKLYKVQTRQMKVWSDLVQPPGIMAVCSRPRVADLEREVGALLPLSLVCDGMRDAGELGAVVRSAAAACCDKVIITRGCMDVWDPRVLRAAAGAHFHVNIIDDVAWELVTNYFTDSTTRFFVVDTSRNEATQFTIQPGCSFDSDLKSSGLDSDCVDDSESIRSSTGGLFSKEDVCTEEASTIESASSTKRHISKPEHTISQKTSRLDVKDAEEASHKQAMKPESGVLDCDPALSPESTTSEEPHFTHAAHEMEAQNKPRRTIQDLPCWTYDAIRYGKGGSVVIVGSKEGPSREALKLLHGRYGEMVSLPGAGKGLRLPPAVTASVVLFELKRQLEISNRDQN